MNPRASFPICRCLRRCGLSLLLGLGLTLAPGSARAAEPAAVNKQIVWEAFTALDRQDDARIRALLPEDAAIQIAGMPEPLKREELLAFLREYWRAFPDTAHTLHLILAEGDWVAVRVTCEGTQRGDYEGVPASGRHIAYAGVHFMRMEKGLIREWWVLEDSLGMMRQLGMRLVPARAPEPPEKGK